uniref:protein UXT-like n=1 Tax=Styela clava TaxID=7725 RepID=UPI00193A26DF|nr:protein UXT-like [Styela clava]
MDKANIDDKVLKYEHFVNETLRGDLKNLNDLRDKVYGEISEYLQLQTTLQKLEECKANKNNQPLKTQVDIGCNFFAQAVVDDPSKVFVCVGYGFYVEYTYKEALEFIDKRVKILNKQAENFSKDMAHVRAQIRLVLEGLRELQGLS